MSRLHNKKEPVFKTACLGKAGQYLQGVAVGIMISRFVIWCRTEGFIPVLDFRGVSRISSSVIQSMERHYSENTPLFKEVDNKYKLKIYIDSSASDKEKYEKIYNIFNCQEKPLKKNMMGKI